jgi:hypothetical protein
MFKLCKLTTMKLVEKKETTTFYYKQTKNYVNLPRMQKKLIKKI